MLMSSVYANRGGQGINRLNGCAIGIASSETYSKCSYSLPISAYYSFFCNIGTALLIRQIVTARVVLADKSENCVNMNP